MDRFRCFLVERVNEARSVEACPDDECEGHEVYLFDARRVDTGAIVGTSWSHMRSGELESGAMWWTDMTESYRPSGPQDHSDRTPAQLADLTARVVEHPEWYEHWGVDEATGLPNRAPSHTFADGPQLYVQTPGGQWNISSRASNCALPFDYEHRCWVVHGEPPDVTVDKAGPTCAAGGGSIQCGDFHGFLRDGWIGP